MNTPRRSRTEDAQHTQKTRTKPASKRKADKPVTGPELPGLDMARIAVAFTVCSRHGRTLRPVLTGGALRVLLGLVAATDESGRVVTGAGANVLFDSKTYYLHLAELVAAGYLRKIERSAYERRHAEVTAAGQAEAARTGRLIERAARAFIGDSAY